MARPTDTTFPGSLGGIESRLATRWGAKRISLAAMACAMLVWAMLEHVGGSAVSTIPPLELVWFRYLVHLAFMLLVVAPWTRRNLIRTRFPAVQIGRSLLMLGMPLCWILAAQRMAPSSLMSILWAAMLLATALAAVVLREKPSPMAQVLLLGGFVGVLLVLHPVIPTGRGGPLFAAGMSTCFALYVVGTRWLRQEPTQVNLFHSALSVFVVLSAVVPFIWQRPPLSAALPIVAVGLLGYVSLLLLDRALHFGTVAEAAPAAFLQPAIEAAALGWPFGRSVALGLAIIAVAALVSALAPARAASAAHDE
jgi:drug/metabolite transporter (DMT)-like permease